MIVYGSAGLLAFAAGAYVLSSKPSKDGSPRNQSPSATGSSPVTTSGGVSTQNGESAMISVRVVYFGMPLTVTGTKKETVKLNSPAYLSDLKDALTILHPDLKKMLPTMLFLVDGQSAIGNPQLEDNWEVDILALGVGG